MFPYSYLIWLFLSGKESASFSFFPIVPPFAQVKHIQFNSVYIVMYLCLPFYFHLTFIYINCVFVYLHLILFFCFAQTTELNLLQSCMCVCVNLSTNFKWMHQGEHLQLFLFHFESFCVCFCFWFWFRRSYVKLICCCATLAVGYFKFRQVKEYFRLCIKISYIFIYILFVP